MANIEVKVPDIGDFKDVPVIELFVKVGDTIKLEDPICSLESDKATMEVPSTAAGVIKELKIKLGDKVSEGVVLLLRRPLQLRQLRLLPRQRLPLPRRPPLRHPQLRATSPRFRAFRSAARFTRRRPSVPTPANSALISTRCRQRDRRAAFCSPTSPVSSRA